MNKQEFIVVLVVTFAVGIIWAVSEVAHNSSNFTPDPKVKSVLEEKVNPTFDQEALEQVNAAVTPAPSVAATPAPSTSPSPSASPRTSTSPRASATPRSSSATSQQATSSSTFFESSPSAQPQ